MDAWKDWAEVCELQRNSCIVVSNPKKTCRVPRSCESVSEVKNTYDTYKYLEYICKCQMLWNNLLWTDESKMDLLATVRTDVF